ncbi:MAG: DUF4124 domain-containing protein [Methylacidiphilales bacterium]|nr:DUF4124 domain-containing protein [Candidatus Methylacidiphilales bacterium]
MAKVIISILCVLVTAGLVNAQKVYKWKENGVIHYGPTLPQGQVDLNADIFEKNKIQGNVETPTQSSVTNETKTNSNTEVDPLKIELEKAQKEICNELKKKAKNLSSNSRIFNIDEAGKRSYLSKDQKAKELEDVQNTISSDCK